MQAAVKPSHDDAAPLAEQRYLRNYWRAYKEAWEVAWQFAPVHCGKLGIEAMRGWTDDIAHRVATNFADVRCDNPRPSGSE